MILSFDADRTVVSFTCSSKAAFLIMNSQRTHNFMIAYSQLVNNKNKYSHFSQKPRRSSFSLNFILVSNFDYEIVL